MMQRQQSRERTVYSRFGEDAREEEAAVPVVETVEDKEASEVSDDRKDRPEHIELFPFFEDAREEDAAVPVVETVEDEEASEVSDDRQDRPEQIELFPFFEDAREEDAAVPQVETVEDEDSEVSDDGQDRPEQLEFLRSALDKRMEIMINQEGEVVVAPPPPPTIWDRIRGTAKGAVGGGLGGLAVGAVLGVVIISGGTALLAAAGAASAGASAATSGAAAYAAAGAASAGASAATSGAATYAAAEAATLYMVAPGAAASFGGAVGAVAGGVGGGVRGWVVVDNEDLDAFFEGMKSGVEAGFVVVALASAAVLRELGPQAYENGKKYHFRILSENEKVSKLDLDRMKNVQNVTVGELVAKGAEKKIFEAGPDEVIVWHNVSGIRANDPEAIVREGKKMQKLNGTDGLAPIKGWARKNNFFGFFMEKYKGDASSCESFLRQGCSDLSEACKQAAQGLQNMHEKGYAHFDVKPANLFVDQFNKLIVGDFGGAQKMDSQRRAAPEAFTPAFSPPEYNYQNSVNGAKYDAYSFGKTLECILEQSGRSVSNVMQSFIEKLTDPNPENRWDLSEALQNWPGVMHW